MEENNFLKIDFDSSSLTAANISEEQFEAGIQEKVQLILQKEFPETRQKQYIKKETTGINFACPICHDSAFDPRKKRGHIAFRGRHAGLYTCFNSCGSMSLKTFFKNFGTDLSLTDINYISNNYTNPEANSQELSNNITSNIINKEEDLPTNPSVGLIVYSETLKVKGALHIVPNGLLFKKGVREYEIDMSLWDGEKVFFCTQGGDVPFDIFDFEYR